MQFDIVKLLNETAEMSASDIHLQVGYPPIFRVKGVLTAGKYPPLNNEQIQSFIQKIMPSRLNQSFNQTGGADFSYMIPSVARYRVSAYKQRTTFGLSARAITLKIPTFEELEFPPAIKRISNLRRGLVLVTGMTGCGKSTTLASMINYIGNTRNCKIITAEDPIEYMFLDCKRSLVSQREVGTDVDTFVTALKQSLRQDPDVILIGEMRDVDSIRIAIKAAETGHLVFSTVHTTNAPHTIERIISNFPQDEQELVTDQLALNLRAIISQRLVKRADGSGRIAAMETLIVNLTVSKLIKENRLLDIRNIMMTGIDDMQVFDQALANLYRENKITYQEGEAESDDIHAYKRFTFGTAASGDKGVIIG